MDKDNLQVLKAEHARVDAIVDLTVDAARHLLERPGTAPLHLAYAATFAGLRYASEDTEPGQRVLRALAVAAAACLQLAQLDPRCTVGCLPSRG